MSFSRWAPIRQVLRLSRTNLDVEARQHPAIGVGDFVSILEREERGSMLMRCRGLEHGVQADDVYGQFGSMRPTLMPRGTRSD